MALNKSRISELAAAVTTHTTKIDKFLAENSLQYPSFEADGPCELGLPPEIETSRAAVLEASQELNDLLQGPRELLFNHHVRQPT